MSIAKTHCNRPLPGSALFCPQCGTNLGDPTYTLDEMLDAQHLHLGHDYRVRVTNAMVAEEEDFAIEHFRTFARYDHLAGVEGQTLCQRPRAADIKIVATFSDCAGSACPTCTIEDDNRNFQKEPTP